MPQLKSGRHVALSASPYLDALAAERDETKYFAIVALRLHASTLSLTASIEPPDDRVNRATQRFAEGSNVCGF